MKKAIILSLVFLISGLVYTAQCQRSMYCDFQSRENLRQEYINLVTKKLELNNAQVAAFLPLLKELDEKRFGIWAEAHRLGRLMQEKRLTPESVCQSYLDASIDARIETALLEKEYYTKFAKILPASKLIKLRQANREFARRFARGMPDKPDL